jgi:hypothetical protein
MKKNLSLVLLIAFLPTMVFAQEKVEAPAWNVGDKWTFTGDGSIEVVKMDQSGYNLKFSDKNSSFESQDLNTILFEKSTRNRINVVAGDKRKKYEMGLSKIFDFPLIAGKEWKSAYSSLVMHQWSGHRHYYDYSEIYKVLGWEDVVVQGGKYKALRVEYRRKAALSSGGVGNIDEGVKNQYWYSPDVKYFVKCQYDKDWMKDKKGIFNWELASFQLKK